MRRYEISDENWERIAPLLPGKQSDPGRTAEDNRRFINGVLWIARSGAAWRDLPERYGNLGTVFFGDLTVGVRKVSGKRSLKLCKILTSNG